MQSDILVVMRDLTISKKKIDPLVRYWFWCSGFFSPLLILPECFSIVLFMLLKSSYQRSQVCVSMCTCVVFPASTVIC